jgi:hypothetical protein
LRFVYIRNEKIILVHIWPGIVFRYFFSNNEPPSQYYFLKPNRYLKKIF